MLAPRPSAYHGRLRLRRPPVSRFLGNHARLCACVPALPRRGPAAKAPRRAGHRAGPRADSPTRRLEAADARPDGRGSAHAARRARSRACCHGRRPERRAQSRGHGAAAPYGFHGNQGRWRAPHVTEPRWSHARDARRVSRPRGHLRPHARGRATRARGGHRTPDQHDARPPQHRRIRGLQAPHV